MMVIASFLTAHFREWRRDWHGVQRSIQIGGDAVGASNDANDGILAAIDFETGEIVRSVTLNSPSGFAIHGDDLYVASMYGNRIVRLGMDFGVRESFATRLMNDLHNVIADDGGLLVACSGTDSVIELDYSGVQKWCWLATQHGFRSSASGHRAWVDTSRDYRASRIGTTSQATHCNSVRKWRLNGRDVVLLTLFHQGQVIAVDSITGRASVLLRGMRNPHSLRRAPEGWIISDSGSNAVVIVSEDFWITRIIEHGFNWVQDALAVDGGILVADANNCRIVMFDRDGSHQLHEISYPGEWKVYQLEIASVRWEEGIRRL